MHRSPSFRLSLLTLLLALALAGCERRGHLVEQHWLEFGTIITLTLITDDLKRAEDLLADIERDLRRYRRQWHAWEDSDLTRFNAALARGETTEIPASLRQLLRYGLQYHAASGGRFDPALGSLVAAQGFHGGQADRIGASELRDDLPAFDDLEIDGTRARSRHPRLQLDFGGIAKGYALALIGDRLERNGIRDYLINAGGDLKTGGSRFGRPWRIGIQNPWAPGTVASIELEGSHSLFTSGNYRRAYRQGSRIVHHIVDPRTGRSSRGQSSASVLVGDPVLADVAATALMVDGADSHRELAAALQFADFMLITDTREIVVSRAMFDRIRISAPWTVKIVN
ncbi:MAG: FAD:protein FMN transferase [Gammaproteobacteria bacterium]|nr:FAD:protein FMN transferase [Gammaproteobacteria bacterium]